MDSTHVARRSYRLLGSNNLIEPLDNVRHFLWACSSNSPPDSFCRQRPDLTDLYPRSFRETLGVTFQSEGKARALRHTRQSDSNDGSRSLVKDILTENEHWTIARSLSSSGWVQVCPTYVPS